MWLVGRLESCLFLNIVVQNSYVVMKEAGSKVLLCTLCVCVWMLDPVVFASSCQDGKWPAAATLLTKDKVKVPAIFPVLAWLCFRGLRSLQASGRPCVLSCLRNHVSMTYFISFILHKVSRTGIERVHFWNASKHRKNTTWFYLMILTFFLL